MKKLIFALSILLASNVFAATGSGHAQAELSQPLVIETLFDISFGTVAIDPSAGPQTLDSNPNISCPTAYVCSGTRQLGQINIKGAPDTIVTVSLEGSLGIVSDGTGNTMTFDPIITSTSSDTRVMNLGAAGSKGTAIGGELQITGNEPGGVYSTQNAGGLGYQITVNYN